MRAFFLAPLVAAAETPLRRVSLAEVDPLALCGSVGTDGSPAVYYWKASETNSSTWVVDLEGGGWCDSAADCDAHCAEKPWLCSSKEAPETLDKGGLLGDQDLLRDANKAFLRYCTADAHMGDGFAFGRHFRGARVVQALLRHLASDLGLGRRASLLLLGGQSAGARGVMANLDYVPEMLGATALVTTVGFLDSPLWIDMPPMPESGFIGFNNSCRNVYSFANVSRLGAQCRAFYAAEPWKCLMGQYRMAFLRTPYLLVASQFDSFQLKKNVGHRPSSFAEKVYSEHFANRTRSLVRELRSGWPFSGEQNGVFSWACYSHATSLDQSFEHMATTDGTTLAKAGHQSVSATLEWPAQARDARLDVTSASVAALAAVQQLDVWGQICWVSAFDSLDSLQWLFIRQRFGAGFFETVGSEFASLSIAVWVPVGQRGVLMRRSPPRSWLSFGEAAQLIVKRESEGRGVAGQDVRAGLVQACPEGAFLRLMGDPRKVFFEAQQAIQSNLGHAASTTTAGLAQQVFDFELPVIPPGAKTTIIPVAFPINSLPEKAQERTVQELKILAVFGLAVGFWVLPYVLINRGACCRCFQRWLSRHMRCYFCTGLIFVLCAVAYMIASQPDVNANDIFFCFVNILEMLSDKLMDVLTQLSMVLGIVLVWFLRKKIVSLLGYDQQLVRAELKETC
ncbi:unnamed protein product [Effrenium voratum]|uniref:Pectin acetylesterase n=1 Tax=Effrenium voratum TaxID=2562239 RepID=A0AA36J3T0_9DINO|nr:unnamed protein product [Effrenium voratum]